MIIDLLGGSYLQKYKACNPQRTINWFCVPSTAEEKSKTKMALFPTPGLPLWLSIPGRYGRGIFTARTHDSVKCFAVVDQILYEITGNQSYINRGTLTNLAYGASKVYMTCDTNNELGIFHNSASYVFNFNTNTLTQITSNQFIGSITYASYSDGYTFVTSGGAVYFNLNNNLAATAPANGGWLLTQTFTPTFTASGCKAVIALHEEVYCFTSESIETFINDGTSPYSRLPRSTVSIGLTSIDSLVKTNDGFIFVGKTTNGESDVYFFDSYYSCNEIAPLSCTYIMNSSPESLSDSYATVQYTKDGHILYRLTIPHLNTTYVYDFVTKIWTEQQSQIPINDSNGDVNQNVHRARHYTNFNSNHLFTDLYSGNILIEDYNSVTENNTPILRTRISQTYWEQNKNIAVYNLEIDTNTGYGNASTPSNTPLMMLSASKDGGYTYGDTRNISLGSAGNHTKRARLRTLGTSRLWTLKLVVSDSVDTMVQNATASGTIGSF